MLPKKVKYPLVGLLKARQAIKRLYFAEAVNNITNQFFMV